MKDSDVWRIVMGLMVAALLASMIGIMAHKTPTGSSMLDAHVTMRDAA